MGDATQSGIFYNYCCKYNAYWLKQLLVLHYRGAGDQEQDGQNQEHTEVPSAFPLAAFLLLQLWR